MAPTADPAHRDAESFLRARAEELAARDATAGSEAGRLVAVRRIPSRPARHATPTAPLPPAIRDRLPEALWCHQAAAVDELAEGRSVVLATGTGSGKSLVAQIAIARATTDRERPGTALAVFPTKALARDQLRGLQDAAFPGVNPAVYDGDTGRSERSVARRDANTILTNPEMLHCSLLPHHARWATFFARLSVVFIDELHVFRGVFGSHVGHLIRRLRRIAAHYGAEPVFVTASATVGAPGALARSVTGVDIVEITDDGSPSAERIVAVWNPPLVDAAAGVRASTSSEVAALVADLTGRGYRAIAFCSSRRGAEIVADRARNLVSASRRDRIVAYRGGLLADERHAIEDGLVAGDLDAVVATSALELGVDIAGLDACVIDGYPGTVASFRQRVGRVGRGQGTSVSVLVCGTDQLDQWIARHPDELFERPPEPAVVNLANPEVLDRHLACAAFELPLSHDDDRWWPDDLDEAVLRLALDGALTVRPAGTGAVRGRRRRASAAVSASPLGVWSGNGWPIDGVGLRTGGGGTVKIVRTDGSDVGTVDRARAPETVHEQASYLHRGIAYRVVEFDPEEGRAIVVPDDGATVTSPRTRRDLRVVGVDERRAHGPAELALGDVVVTTEVIGFERRDARTGTVLERPRLELPPTVLATRAVWRVIPEAVLAGVGLVPDTWPGTLHAAEHAAIGLLPRFAVCDRWDVGGVSTVRHADTGGPTIVIHDGRPGGAGIAELAFAVAEEHDRAVAAMIAECPCRSGCPACVQSPKCGNGNEPLDKAGALALSAALAGLEPEVAPARSA